MNIYRIEIAKENFRKDLQFLKIQNANEIASVVLREKRDRGILHLEWSGNDGILTTPPAIKKDSEQTEWNFGGLWQTEKLRIYGEMAAAPDASLLIKTGNSGKSEWAPLDWSRSGQGWYEADVNGLYAESLKIAAPPNISELYEIQVFASCASDKNPEWNYGIQAKKTDIFLDGLEIPEHR
ncbi:hypothetical protein K7I13_14985 [Brucepastera parasyntrophica]|uniref:hypothetical protein n=1 Tax=Brucepastera parasyntrophica TaxID=2880008 RepID=UPI00210C8065|nr:hypothetical protein [Brucepastera parasyntrophica]ULQ59736.1 hypothetical protein K7I13_14985 [Brucepastera parasyntrophica]